MVKRSPSLGETYSYTVGEHFKLSLRAATQAARGVFVKERKTKSSLEKKLSEKAVLSALHHQF